MKVYSFAVKKDVCTYGDVTFAEVRSDRIFSSKKKAEKAMSEWKWAYDDCDEDFFYEEFGRILHRPTLVIVEFEVL